MANMLRYSYHALGVIPEEKQYLAHRMYEDSDLDGATQAERLLDYLEQEMPGQIIGILANDSVTPPCCNQELHYECDFYEPHWSTVLVSKATWDEYKDSVMARDLQHKAAHGCRQEPKTYPDVESAQAALDRGETVRIEVEPFQVDPQLVQMAIDLQHKDRFEQWKQGETGE